MRQDLHWVQRETCSHIFQRSIKTPKTTQAPAALFSLLVQVYIGQVLSLHLHTNRHYKVLLRTSELRLRATISWCWGELHFKRWNKDVTLENLQSIWSGLALPCLQVCLLFCCTNLQQKQMSVCRAVFLCWQEPRMFKQLPQILGAVGSMWTS